jgi:nucleoside-diphosphate-sugar epimerase
MAGADAVVHCAAFASEWGPMETFVPVNAEGSRHIFDAALARDEAVGEGYIVGDGAAVTWKELTDLLAGQLDLPPVKRTISLPLTGAVASGGGNVGQDHAVDQRPVLTRYELEIGGRDMHFSNGKIVRGLGFSPRALPEEGLARTIEWLKSVDLSKVKTK